MRARRQRALRGQQADVARDLSAAEEVEQRSTKADVHALGRGYCLEEMKRIALMIRAQDDDGDDDARTAAAPRLVAESLSYVT